jgi:RNA polymerase sigma-70 factor (ECF subfamily)
MTVISTVDTWNQFSDQIQGFFAKRVNDSSVAEDLRQEVFLKIHASLDQLKDSDKLRPWIFAIARNILHDYHKSRGKDISETEIQFQYQEDPQFESDIRSCLIPMIEKLPEKYRDALLYSEIQGMSQKALAENLGLSHSAARSRVQRGRELLKTSFIECCDYRLDDEGKLKGVHEQRDDCVKCN